MAITVTVVNEGSTTVDATVDAHAAVTLTPAANRLFFAVSIASKASTVDVPTVSGTFATNNGTWTLEGQPAWGPSNLKRTSCWRSIDASGLGVLTYNYTNTNTSFHRYLLQFDGVMITGTNGADWKAQGNSAGTRINNTTAVTTTEVDFPNAFEDAVNNLTFFIAGTGVNGIPTKKAGYSGATGQATATPGMGSIVEWLLGEDQTPNVTHGSAESGGQAWEIRMASAGGDLLLKMAHYTG